MVRGIRIGGDCAVYLFSSGLRHPSGPSRRTLFGRHSQLTKTTLKAQSTHGQQEERKRGAMYEGGQSKHDERVETV